MENDYTKYDIVRFYKDRNIPTRTIRWNVSKREAVEHCHNPETSSSTCKLPHNKRRTKKLGPWFDGFRKA